jgi:hypothetical protein
MILAIFLAILLDVPALSYMDAAGFSGARRKAGP